MKQKRTERINIRLTPEEKKQYEMAAKKEGISLASYFRRAVKQTIWQNTAVKS